ncbi:hypothetical protein CALVIDRAFT_537593 [Calocera viscosa TUFC12733]|uniref:Uncharacterized protein n=1 Tax=Calocera viscosa (strain TUFC12733) TaxID=1330018 RepID=A0A167LTB8_CALVF|nr:hypothetical protein CALVIDRAFT_537593 [Calocera viscosa TUFC12733]
MAGDDDLPSSPSSVDTERAPQRRPSVEPYAALLATFTSSLRIIHSLSVSLASHGADLYDNGTQEDHSALLVAAELAAYALLDLSGDAEALADVPSLDILESVEDEHKAYPIEEAEGHHILVQSFVSAAPRIRDVRLDLRTALQSLAHRDLTPAEDEEFHALAVDVRAQSRELAFGIASFSDEVHTLIDEPTSDEGEAEGLDTIPEEEEEWDADVVVAIADGALAEVTVDEHVDADDEDDGSSSDEDTIETPLRRSVPIRLRAKGGESTSDSERATATRTPGLTDQSGTDSSLRSLPPYMTTRLPSDGEAPSKPTPTTDADSSVQSAPNDRTLYESALQLVPFDRHDPAAPESPGALAYVIAVTFQLWVLVADLPSSVTVLARPWGVPKSPSRRREPPE